MVENDIYDNKSRYERFLKRLKEKTLPPEERPHKDKRQFYTIRNRYSRMSAR